MPEVTFAPSAEDFAEDVDHSADLGDEGREEDSGAEQTEDVERPSETREAAKDTKADAESEARRFGWVPKGDFKGPPGKWRSAEDFLAIQNESAPILKERMNKMREDYDAKFARLERQSAKALELQRNRLEEEHLGKIRDAALSGDADEVERLVKSAPQVETAPPAEVEAFVTRNPWFLENPRMHGVAVAIEEEIANADPGMTLADRLAETERRMSAIYPSVKSTAPANKRPGLPPSNEGVRLTARKSPVDKLTSHERSMGKMLIEQNAYKNMEEYAASLDEDTFVVGKKARG